MKVRAFLLAAALAACAVAATAPAASACMGCDGFCELWAAKVLVPITHSSRCPVE
jgi:hypothetical protein